MLENRANSSKISHAAAAYLGSEILQDGGQIDGSSGADTLGVLSGLEEPGDPADGELEAGFVRSGNGLGGLGLAATSLGGTAGGTHRRIGAGRGN